MFHLAVPFFLASSFALQQPDLADLPTRPIVKDNALSVSGDIRLRTQYRTLASLTAGGDDVSLSSARLRFGFGAKVDRYNRVKVVLQEVIADHGGVSLTDLHHLSLGMDHLFHGLFDLELGRLQFDYGKGRMLSSLDWDDQGRSWDGARITAKIDQVDLAVLAARPVVNQGAIGAEDLLAGVYASTSLDFLSELDGYFLMRRTGPGTPNFDDQTVGGRAALRYFDVDWDVEFALQSGTHDGHDVSGTAFALSGDYALDDGITVGGAYEYASGGDGTDAGFVPLSEDSHNYHGLMDIVQWANLSDISIRAGYKVGSRWEYGGALHLLSRVEAGSPVSFGEGAGSAVSGTGTSIGTEIDLWAEGRFAPGVVTTLGVGEFLAGDAIAGGDSQTWIWFQVRLEF